ncbi:MAG TPA: hypothetical protein VFJ16_07485 [Longimicrobium sp.]|nr:hypothetical protein [Longimicrobium sp.]
MKRILAAAIAVLSLAIPRAARAQDEPDAREYAVWNAAIDSLYPDPDLRVLLLDGAQVTWAPPSGDAGAVLREKARAAGADAATAEALVAAMRHPVQIDFAVLSSPREVVQSTRTEAMAAFREAGGATTSSTSTGVVTLSRPGFSADGNTAVVMAELLCGTRCHEGRMVRLARAADESWHVANVIPVW